MYGFAQFLKLYYVLYILTDKAAGVQLHLNFHSNMVSKCFITQHVGNIRKMQQCNHNCRKFSVFSLHEGEKKALFTTGDECFQKDRQAGMGVTVK